MRSVYNSTTAIIIIKNECARLPKSGFDPEYTVAGREWVSVLLKKKKKNV